MPDVSHSDMKISKTHVPTTFNWNGWGSNVELAGSFDSPYTPWQPIQMKRVENSSHFEITLDLQPNQTYYYKFVVDANWVCDPDRPKFPDSYGNENHQVYVEAPKEPESPTINEQEIEESNLKDDEHENQHDVKPESPTINEQEIEESNLKDDEHENQHDVKPEQQLIEQQIMDEVEETIEEVEKIVNEQEIEEQNIVNEQETEVNIVNEQETEVNIVNEQEIEEKNIFNEQETEVNIVNEQQIEEQNIFNKQETEVNISNEQEIEEQNIVNEQETEVNIDYEQEIEGQNIVNEQEIEEQKIVNEVNIVNEQVIKEQNIVNEQETEVNIDYEQEIEGQNIVNEQEIEEQKIVNEQETEVNIVNEQVIEEQNIANEQETEVNIDYEQEIEGQNIVIEQEIEEQKIVNEQETEVNIINEQVIEEQNIVNEQETEVNIDYEQEIEEQNIVNEQEIEEHDEQINIVNEQETEEKEIVYEQETEVFIINEQEIEEQNIVNEQETEVNIVNEQEIEEQNIICEQEIEKGSPNEISITAIKEATVEKADEINNIIIEKEEKPIEVEEPEEKQEIIEGSIEEVYIETKTLENATEEKSVDSGVESVVKTVVESAVESSDIPHTDEINNITNSLQPSQIIKEEIDTSEIIINETTSEIQVEEISETPPELNLPNEPITETEVPSTTEESSITEVPSVTEVSSITEVPSITEISDDIIDKKVNEETTLPALDLTVTVSNATIIDNTNNTDNTSHKDEIIGEKVEPHESTSDLMIENIIVEKESIVQELEENPMKETETFKERNVIDQYVISDTNEILSMSVEEIHKDETVQEQTLPVLEKTLEVSSLTQQSPSINSSILEVSEVPKESLTTTYEQISTQPENLEISHKTETNEVINNHDNLDNLENNITERNVEEFVQANVKNELNTYDDGDTIVEENSNDVVSENLSSINIIQESTCNDSLEENVEKSIPVQDEEIEISKVKYDDWEVQIAENNTTEKSVDETQINEQMPSPDESPDHEPEIEPINENEVKGLSVSTHEETISEEKLQGIYEINEVHAHMMDNKPEPEMSLNSLTSYENEEQSSDYDENSHHDNPTKMDNEAFIIKDTETETNHTENLNKVDKIYTISYDNVNIVSEIQNNLSISQKDSMTEDIKLHEFESMSKITTDNNMSGNLSDEEPGSSATACTTTTVFNSSDDDDKSDSYLIPNEKDTAEIKSISKSTNGRKRGMTIFSPGESTKDVSMIKSRHTNKNLNLPSSREVVTAKKSEQKYEEKDNDTKGNIFYLMASLVTTFVLGIISMLIKAVSRNRR